MALMTRAMTTALSRAQNGGKALDEDSDEFKNEDGTSIEGPVGDVVRQASAAIASSGDPKKAYFKLFFAVTSSMQSMTMGGRALGGTNESQG
jgi:hypothetical protein